MADRWRVLVLAALFVVGACGAATVGEPQDTEDVATDPPVASLPGDSVGPRATESQLAAPDDGHGRPATIRLTLANTLTKSDGAYTAAGPARFCGNAVYNMTGNTRAFNFEFPSEGQYAIEDVSFGATDLVGGTTTGLFSIGVNVITSAGAKPPATVIHPNQAGSGDSGTATRTESGSTTTLVVHAVNRAGETLDLTATCGPRPS